MASFFWLKPAALALLAFTASAAVAHDTSSPVMVLVVDETQAARRIAFVHEEIRVQPGPVTLAYPRWIPGEHGPTGPVQQFAALQVRSGNETLPWTRDPDDIYMIHIQVPANPDRISVDFDVLLANTISDHQLLLAWNTVVLYPIGIDKSHLMVEPSIVLPQGWGQASSLNPASQVGSRVTFAALSLERLIDSPVLAGEFLRVVPLNSSWPAELDITGDSQSMVDHANDVHAFDLFANLVEQDRAMFGFRHWRTFHLLVAQSDALRYDGLEHEDSPWVAVGAFGLSKREQLEKLGWPLIAHEQSHSWDGKYRRPAELYSKPDYQGPERTTMLWVYEGLNQYIGMVLATRAGFNDAAYIRDFFAQTAAYWTAEPGRATTPLVDTATESWVLRAVSDDAWSSLLRNNDDYFWEGALVWLRADTLIREQSHGRVSLDDFLRNFFGQRDTDPIVVPYRREDVEKSLAEVWPFDWHTFFETRIYEVNNKPPTDGIAAAGWRLIYNDTPNNESPYPGGSNGYDAWYSIGLSMGKDNTVDEVLPGSPAYEAGLGPHMSILAVDGYPYSSDALNEAIARPKNARITLVVRNFDTVKSLDIQYAGGVRHPHLERVEGTRDYLSDILAPRKLGQ